MTTEDFPVRLAMVGLVVISAGAILTLFFVSQMKPAEGKPEVKEAAAVEAAAPAPSIVAAPAATVQPPPALAPAQPAKVHMELDAQTIDKFQEASNRAAGQLLSGGQSMPYPIAASLALRQGIAELGYDPDLTLLYWLSPAYAADALRGNPQESSGKIRLTENYLSIALGDGTSEEEFTRVLSAWSPEVQTKARERRTRITRTE